MKTPFIAYLLFALPLLISHLVNGQEKHTVQIKVFDEQMKPFPGLDISLNGESYITVGKNASVFVELPDSELPPKSVKIGNKRLEAASWNYSKGVLQIVIRKKNYELIEFLVRDQHGAPVGDREIMFRGATTVTTRTDEEGKIEIPVALDESALGAGQFSVAGYKVTQVIRSENENSVVVEPTQTVTQQIPAVEQPAPVRENYFKDFDLSQLDSIKSLTVFYAIFKNYHVQELDDEVKQKLDAKLKTLVEQLGRSSTTEPASFIGRISDSSFVSDDIENLLAHASQENQELDQSKTNFDEKIQTIREKLETGIDSLNTETRQKLLADLRRLEQILEENESKFYSNQSHYRLILSALNENFFNYESLENRLSLVEAERLREQEVFRKRLLTILSVVGIFGVLLVLLIVARNKLKAQKKELVVVNNEIKRMNENLEALVSQRTKLLQEANRELDLFLYKASHDLKSPVCSIIGLGNIAAASPDNTDSRDLFARVIKTAHSMDRLLNKLRIISEINQPGEFSSLDIFAMIQGIKGHFMSFIQLNKIELSIDCPKDLKLYSNKTLTEAILFYLLENALFFCTLKSTGTPKTEFIARETNGSMEFSIYDNGIGIDSSIRERIYEMFYIGNERSPGNGLGLYIVAKAVHVLKGDIKLDSEVNAYSRFVVTIPIRIPKVHTAFAVPESAPEVTTGNGGIDSRLEDLPQRR